LDELVDVLRGAAGGSGTALAMFEHEDEWFAIVRADGDDDPRLFVSNLEAASHSIFAGVIGSESEVDAIEADDDEVEPTDEDWAGEIDLLADLGVSSLVLHQLVEQYSDDPGAALTQISETIGFGDLLQSLR
jgi:putative tRNA adenosine deaminase-associated protein